MISTTIFPGRYVQGYEAIKRLGTEVARFGKKAYLICDPYVYDHVFPAFREQIESSLDLKTERFGGECSDEEIERIAALARPAGSEVIIGMGGGKTLDTAKGVAYTLHLPCVVVPTAASTDAPASALAVIYTPSGEFKRYLVLPSNPNLVLVDTRIVAEAPVRFLVSGMGDALATWFEASSCERKYAPNMTGDIGSHSAYALAHLCYELLMDYGIEAKVSCESKVVTPALERIVEANTLLSGLGFESGGLAAAHAIHNGLTVLEQTHAYWHGEKVAFGTLASLFLTDKDPETIDEVYTFCEDVGLPTTLAQIGLENATPSDLMRAAEAACAPGETMANEPLPITAQMVQAALIVADAEGRRRKSLLE